MFRWLNSDWLRVFSRSTASHPSRSCRTGSSGGNFAYLPKALCLIAPLSLLGRTRSEATNPVGKGSRFSIRLSEVVYFRIVGTDHPSSSQVTASAREKRVFSPAVGARFSSVFS